MAVRLVHAIVLAAVENRTLFGGGLGFLGGPWVRVEGGGRSASRALRDALLPTELARLRRQANAFFSACSVVAAADLVWPRRTSKCPQKQ